MKKSIVKTPDAPAAIGPYSQAVLFDGILYCSGQIPLNPGTMEIVTGGVKDQTQQVMDNLEQVLLAAGSDFSKVLKTTIYLADMNDFSVVNEVYGSKFPQNPPARETVAVKTLPKEVLVEISCIAHL
ncbi:MAG: RidA family protein [Balneolaceae bacterium]|nr:MAG: RidA family protein [Balneolaceae bacterium]